MKSELEELHAAIELLETAMMTTGRTDGTGTEPELGEMHELVEPRRP